MPLEFTFGSFSMTIYLIDINDQIKFKAKLKFLDEWIESHSILQGETETYLRNETDNRSTWIRVDPDTVQFIGSLNKTITN